jgi:hypothetical protein
MSFARAFSAFGAEESAIVVFGGAVADAPLTGT